MAAAKKPAKAPAKRSGKTSGRKKKPPTAAQRRAAAEKKAKAKAKREGLVVSVFGAFNSQALVQVPIDVAEELFGEKLAAAASTNAIDAVHRDLERLRKRDPDLAESALAAACERMALELEHPFNSATSRSMCVKALHDAMNRLWELAPDDGEDQKDGVDQLARKRKARREGRAAAEG